MLLPRVTLSYTGPFWSELAETMATTDDNTISRQYTGPVISRQYMGPVIFSSTIGTAIEWYDFFLYGTMAALVFPKVFFPGSVPLVGTLLAQFTFLVGFVARLVGGALSGHLGDRVSRKSTLIATLLVMDLATLFIGFLSGYATLGGDKGPQLGAEREGRIGGRATKEQQASGAAIPGGADAGARRRRAGRTRS